MRRLYLRFRVGADDYALAASEVVAVVPHAELKQIPGAPRGIAGMLNYRGDPVPVVDLEEALGGPPSTRRLHTRIVLVHDEPAGGARRLLGLLARDTTSSLHQDDSDFKKPGVVAPPSLGGVAVCEGRVVQRVDTRHLLSAEIRARLFDEAAVIA